MLHVDFILHSKYIAEKYISTIFVILTIKILVVVNNRRIP